MFTKKYQFPVNLFFILEKINPLILLNQFSTFNFYTCVLPSYSINLFSICLKYDLTTFLTSLIEITGLDSKNYLNNLTKDSKIINYNYYIYYTKIRISISTPYSKYWSVNSIGPLFDNASWLEREVSEMLGVNFLKKKDNRLLLLDYSINSCPLLKSFVFENYVDVYYNFFEDRIDYTNSQSVEL